MIDRDDHNDPDDPEDCDDPDDPDDPLAAAVAAVAAAAAVAAVAAVLLLSERTSGVSPVIFYTDIPIQIQWCTPFKCDDWQSSSQGGLISGFCFIHPHLIRS